MQDTIRVLVMIFGLHINAGLAKEICNQDFIEMDIHVFL